MAMPPMPGRNGGFCPAVRLRGLLQTTQSPSSPRPTVSERVLCPHEHEATATGGLLCGRSMGGGGGLRPHKSLCPWNRPPFSGPFDTFHFFPQYKCSDVVVGGGRGSGQILGRQEPPPPPSAGVGKPPHGLRVCIWMHLPTPGVVKQDKSSGGSVDTTKTRLGPQRVRMSGGKRPIGAAKGTQSDTEALCRTPPPQYHRSTVSGHRDEG